MEQPEILEWFSERINFVREYPNHIGKIIIYNDVYENFGKRWLRIYFKIETISYTIHTYSNLQPENERIKDEILSNFERKNDYISYFIGDSSTKDIDYCSIQIVHAHYGWVTSLFKALAGIDKSRYEIKSFERKFRRLND
jgi:hypothetical protein